MRHRAPRPVLDRLRPLARTRGALATATLLLGGILLGAVLSAGGPADDAPAAGPAVPVRPQVPDSAHPVVEPTVRPSGRPTERTSTAARRHGHPSEESAPTSRRLPTRTQPPRASSEDDGGGQAKGREKADGAPRDDRPAPGSRGRSDRAGTKHEGKT